MYIENRKLVEFCYLIFVGVVLLSSLSCSGKQKNDQLSDVKGTIASEEVTGYVKFVAFQNSDSTWGFTMFVKSRPYLHYKRMPFHDAECGFPTRGDAEKIAALFATMIKNGDTSPELNRAAIDTLKELVKKRI